jgi:hypothetical protein
MKKGVASADLPPDIQLLSDPLAHWKSIPLFDGSLLIDHDGTQTRTLDEKRGTLMAPPSFD